MAQSALVQKAELGFGRLSHRPDGAQRRVLYAEDQASSRIVTTAMLEKMGFSVDAVDDGEVAVERARAATYDIILLDIEMPVMDGVTAARTMRNEIESCRNTPILALSAFLADSTEHCHWRDAFDTAVPKPANSNELKRAMRRAMDLHLVPAAAMPVAEAPRAPAQPTENIWQAMKRDLPVGILNMMAVTASNEMRHQGLALAAARESGDLQHLGHCRDGLKKLALNFGVSELVELIAATEQAPRAMNVSAIFALIEDWRNQK